MVTKRLLSFAPFALLAASVGVSAATRELLNAERKALRAAASKIAGIDVWQIEGNVSQSQSGDAAVIVVIFSTCESIRILLGSSGAISGRHVGRKVGRLASS
jgi:hypothetical protein